LVFDPKTGDRAVYDEVLSFDETIEDNHFLMQLFRIPVNEKCTYRKVMQIALNVGQLLGSIDKDIHTYNHMLGEWVALYSLDSLTTYLNEATVIEMTDFINKSNAPFR